MQIIVDIAAKRDYIGKNIIMLSCVL